jgi:Bacterial extracellular solute-binding protein
MARTLVMRLARFTLTGAVSALVLGVTACGSPATGAGGPSQGADAKNVSLSIATNAVAGGKGDLEARWIASYVIPTYIQQMKAKGVTATVTYQPSGVDDEKYKAKLALDLKTASGPDVLALDGIWVGEFAQAGYIQPLDKVAGPAVSQWEGWSQIPKAVQANTSFGGKAYGIPTGTDGRVLYFNKKLFVKAGLPADWAPKSWADILAAGRALKKLPGVTPLQINAGTAMGEATSMQGALPLLAGTGAEIYSGGKWQGNTQHLRDVLTFYKDIYSHGLGNPAFQEAAKGRDESCRRLRRRQDRRPDGKRLLLALGHQPQGRCGTHEQPRRRRGLRDDPGTEARVGDQGSGLRQYVRWHRILPEPQHEVPAAGLGPAQAHVLSKRHQGPAERSSQDHRPHRRQQGGPEHGPASEHDLAQGPAPDRLPPWRERVPAGVGGTAAGDRGHRVRQECRGREYGLPAGGEDRSWCRPR